MKYDLVIKNGTLVEPAAKLVTVANVGIKDGKIGAITRGDLAGEKIIDAAGQIVSPGFVDIHSHVDNYLYGGRSYALQGITTTIGGNCGLSPVPPGDFFRNMQAQGFPINQGQLVGHSFTLRKEVGLKDNYTPASEKQALQMAALAEERLAQGGLGISLGLEYAPGSSYQELLALCRVAARYGKPPVNPFGGGDEMHLAAGPKDGIGTKRDTAARV
jgi:N-acyl-D-amino-acid deacylase